MTGHIGNKAVVIGTNYISILTMARDIGKAGYDIDIIRVFVNKPGLANLMSSMKPEKESRYVKNYHSIIIGEDRQKLVDLLMNISDDNEKRLLVPVDDLPLKVIDEYHDTLAERYILPEAKGIPGEIVKLMNKGLQKELAREAGLPVPEGVQLSAPEDLSNIKDSIFPCFVKPGVSNRNSKLRMGKCDNRQELEKMTLSGISEGQTYVAERYIDIAYEHSVVGICTEDDVRACAGFRSVMPGHSERQGVAVMGITEKDTDFQPVLDGIRRLMKLTGYTGMFDIDLLEDKAGDLYFIEINFRAGASCHAFAYEGGLDIPALYAKHCLMGDNIPYSSVKESGKRFLSEKALLEEFVRGDITKEQFRDSLEQAEVFFVKDDKDPKPYRLFRKYLAMAPILRLVYRFKK